MDSKPVYNDKYIKTTIKIFNNKINTNFHGKKCLKIINFVLIYSVILLNSIFFNSHKESFPQIFL